MNFKTNGKHFLKNTKIKLALCLIISNVICLALFQNPPIKEKEHSTIPSGWIELQIPGELLIPFEEGRKVTAINRRLRKSFPAILARDVLVEGKLNIFTPEENAQYFISHTGWEIAPELKTNLFSFSTKEIQREIHY